MIEASPEYQRMTDALRRYAALSGPFRPVAALREVVGEAAFSDQVLMVEVLSALRNDCTVQKDSEGDLWLMRPGVRRKVLARLDESALSEGRTAAPGRAPTDIEMALSGAGRFAPDAIDRLVADGADTDALTDVIVTLDRAGPGAPGFDRLVALRSALNSARQVRRTDELLAAGFFGREEELRRLTSWISTPQDAAPLRTLHISGLPGIGKSFLLQKIIQLARQDREPVLVHLDFDRSALRVLETQALFEEISRQVGDALPPAAATLRTLRLRAAEDSALLKGGTGRRTVPRELLNAMAEAVRASGRPVLIVLDTLEVLRSQGETFVMTLFDQLDLLVEYGVPGISIISAGRGDALDPVPGRVGGRIVLGGLEPMQAEKLLAKRGVDRKLWPVIQRLAQGNPLLLTLAGKAMEDGGFDPGTIPEDASAEMTGGYLYRAILSRVPGELKDIAMEGLILRKVNARVLEEVVAPALGLTLTEDQAAAMLKALCTQHWLVEEEGDWLRHRTDVRSAFLNLIYEDSPARTAEIDRRAAEWFAASDPVSALYHRLQLMRTGAPLPDVPPDLARAFTEPMLGDLVPRARDAVLQAMGRRSDFGRVLPGEGEAPEKGGWAPPEPDRAPGRSAVRTTRGVRAKSTRAPAAKAPRKKPTTWLLRYDPAARRLVRLDLPPSEARPPDDRAVRDLEIMLERGELREASFVLANGFDWPFRPDTAAGMLVLAHQWQAGQWSMAERILDLLPDRSLDQGIETSPHLLGRTLLETWAEFRFDALVRRLERAAFRKRVLGVLEVSSRIGMSGGALDFAIITAARKVLPEGPLERAYGVLAQHLAEVPPELPHNAMQQAERMRASMRITFPAAGSASSGIAPADFGWAVAPLNPYAGALKAHVLQAEDAGGSAVLAYLDDMRDHLGRAADRFLPGAEGVADATGLLSSAPADVAEVLAVLGLAAEWAEGFAFYHPTPDFPAVAHAAERWRRTVNGVWSYGRRRPRAWRSDRAADHGSERLARRVADAPDPLTSARRTIGFWDDPGRTGPDPGGGPARRRLARRYTAALKAADRAKDPVLVALGSLQRAGVPGVLAAPLAALAATRTSLDVALPEAGTNEEPTGQGETR